MAKSRILLIGKSECNDYVGAKTLYLHNALTSAGLPVSIYDLSGNVDPPADSTHVIFLPWVQKFDSGWLQFMRAHGRRRILYADNFWWYDECRRKLLDSEKVDMDAAFNMIALATSENVRWWPKDKFELWGACVDEDLAIQRTPENYVYIDEIWPEAWSSGLWSGRKIIDLAVPKIKERFGVEVMTQKSCQWTPGKPKPEWVDHWITPGQVDHWIDPLIDLENMLAVIAKAKAFVTIHEESLGLMQLEALTCGVPVVTTPLWTKAEVMKAGPECVFSWQWPSQQVEGEEELVEDPEKAADEVVEAVGKAFEAKREDVREVAVALYGKAAFLDRSGLKHLP